MGEGADVGRAHLRVARPTDNLAEVVGFYRDGLGLSVLNTWDRNPDDRGTIFAAASGMIEVLQLPRGGGPLHVQDDRPPQGAFMVIEVDEQPDEKVRTDIRALPWVRWAFRLDKVSA